MTLTACIMLGLIFVITDIMLMAIIVETNGLQAIGEALSNIVERIDKAQDNAVEMLVYGFDARDIEFFEWVEKDNV